MPSAVHEINNAFNQRLQPIVGLGASRPVNPFASTGVQTSQTKRDEINVRSLVTLPGTLGSQYKGSVIDAKSDDSVRLDTYCVSENPKAKSPNTPPRDFGLNTPED
ncbi:unnamed protein product, partial [Ectocarpus sp. 4 AP-2014]